jgi:hypothetical protein
MVRRPHSGRYPDTLICCNTTCPNVSAKLSIVENRLIDALEDWLKEYRLDWNLINIEESDGDIQLEVLKKAINKADEDLATLKRQINSIHDLLEQGVYSTDTFLERLKILNERIEEVRQNKEKLIHELQKEEMREKSKRTFIPKAERIMELYRSTENPAFKNELLKEVLDRVVYTKAVNGRWHHRPDEFELVLYPKLPKME